MSISDWTAIITATIAILAFGLSIYNFYLARRDKSPWLRVTLNNGFIAWSSETSDLKLVIAVTNPGQVTTTVTNVALLYGESQIVFPHGIEGTTRVPFELPPYKNATFWVPMREVAVVLKGTGLSGSVRMRARISDALGNRYRSSRFSVNVDEWAKSNDPTAT